MEKKKSRLFLELLLNLVLSVLCGCAASYLFSKIYATTVIQDGEYMMIFLYRTIILTPIIFFAGLHFILDIKKMYTWMFDHRWLLVVLFLAFTTALRLHGDSIGYYADVIQPHSGSGFGRTLFGEYRPIRSDEFIVDTPSVLASTYGPHPFSMYNNILRGTNTLNILNGVYGGLATLVRAPWEFAYLILPTEFAFSFCWYAPIVLGFMACLEMFYIISKNKGVAFTGACLVIFSAFYQWWSPSMFYIGGPGTIACLYHFIHSDKIWKKCALGFLTAISFGLFVTPLYPAWQVPLGFVFLVLGIWLIVDNWSDIKAFHWYDWLILALSLILCVGLIGLYFYSILDYIKAISETVYPGKRFETGGSVWIRKLFYYVYAPYFPIKDFGNPCESATFMSLFPLTSIAAIYSWLKDKKKDFLTAALILVEIPMIIFVMVGFPKWLAAITLFFESQPERMVDIIGFIQVILIVILLSRYRKTVEIHKIFALILAVANTALAFYYSVTDYPDYLSMEGLPWVKYVLLGFAFIVFVIFSYGLIAKLSDRWKAAYVGLLAIYSLGTGLLVRPISVGLSSITAKPVYSEIQKIDEDQKDAKWITSGDNPIITSYCVSSGASTLDSVNTYPNLELWEKLDPEGKYEEVYNRYAHVRLILTDEDTSFDLTQQDYMNLHLSYKDVEKTDADYMFAMSGFTYNEDNGYIHLDPIYEEDGITIYKIEYLSSNEE